MVIPNVRTASGGSLKGRVEFRKEEAGYISKIKNNRTVIEMEMSRAFVWGK